MEFRAAAHADYAALYPHRPRRAWRFAAVQISAGSAWTLWHEGRPVAICGLYPLHSGIFEAWVMLARDIPTGAIRTILKRTAAIMPDTIIIARVDESNTAGQRLALLAGFVPVDEFLAGTRKRTWVRPAAPPVFPYIYRWTNMDRKGQRCRVTARGRLNTARVEFEDGHVAIISRNALRKAPTP